MSGPITDDNGERVLAVVAPSAARRVLALAMLWGLGALLVWLAFARPPQALGLRLVLLGFGSLAIYVAERLRRATQCAVELTGHELRESGGKLLCRLDEIEGVERGAFAFKPSNGFVVRTRRSGGRSWAPGLWWRIGNRIGVGGVTPAAQAKFMADLIALHLKGHKIG